MLKFRSRTNPGESTPAIVPDDDGDDALLVAAARANLEDFTLLYRKYANLIYRFCDLRLGDREAAEDATSEVFLKALAGLSGYRGGSFPGWLFRIARNVVTDARRQRGREQASLPGDALNDLMDVDPMPDEQLIRAGDLETLRAAFQGLPEDYRTTLELQLTGLSTEQIAAAMGRSANAVRLLRFRALRHLRDRLIELEGGAA